MKNINEIYRRLSAILIFVLAGIACSRSDKPFVSDVEHPGWSKEIVMYEVNVRQYTPEGTFAAFSGHLQRLKQLGVDVLWFMPIYPIGEVNRKGTLGSYYSVKDFTAVNPEYGTIDDFKSVLEQAHNLGMHVLLDWVPNHTSWDNQLTVDHPDFYVKDSKGNFTPPIGTDWTDVIQLDWSNPGLQDYMIEAMSFWVKMGVDGFRVDHPHNTPEQFWIRARSALNQIQPVLLLAEHEGAGQFVDSGFDMNYSWELHHLMINVAEGKDSVTSIKKYFQKELKVYPDNVYRLQFLTNHDENSWAGTLDSLVGDAEPVLANMIFTVRGVPLLYSGQEVCLNKRLRFFERDTIAWDTCKMTRIYSELISLKKANEALWNGEYGGKMTLIETNRDNSIFAFRRDKGDNRVVVFLNLTKRKVYFKPSYNNLDGDYTDYYSGREITLPLDEDVIMGPWSYIILIRKADMQTENLLK
ncbi:MAG TPA: alpha-amylase family glycosyl hydrolase [Bacteroidales bacterium]|nr:alpha-amylase family glycosyl hydrolase [Bacteroidales bacterium]